VPAARDAIAQRRPYHLVILDMNLPFESRREAEAGDGINPGELLIDLLAARDNYRIRPVNPSGTRAAGS